MFCHKLVTVCEDYLSDARKEKAIQFSHRQKDSLYELLKSSSITLYQNNCYLYTSKDHITRYLKQKRAKKPGTSCIKRSKRSLPGLFDFKKNKGFLSKTTNGR